MLDDLNQRYRRHVTRLATTYPPAEAMSLAVGGGFEAIGRAQVTILKAHGLPPTAYLVDCGCGSGRLASALSASAAVRKYLGFDIVPELVAHACATVTAPAYDFRVATGAAIPEADEVADFVVMFSLLTHLPHELSYIYLSEAHRVLRPGGRLVLSFLEFGNPFHWPTFAGMVSTATDDRHHDQFIERPVLRLWADRLGFSVESMRDGWTYVPDDSFQQSVCVMRRTAPSRFGVAARGLRARLAHHRLR